MTPDEALALYHTGPKVVVKIKNSSKSSKPPSSDITNPKPKKKKNGQAQYRGTTRP